MHKASRAPILCLLVCSMTGCSPKATANNHQGANQAAIDTSPQSTATEAPTANGPFGFAIGEKIDGLKLTKMEKPGFYETDAPPRPNPDFEQVVIEAYPDTGICQIRGVGKDLTADGDGNQVRSRVDELAGTLATKYGEGKLLDHCSGGEIACQSQFWMMNMTEGERFYGYGWPSQNAAMKAADIGEIVVAAGATNIQTSYANVEYHSSKKQACDKARKGLAASSL